MDNEKIFNVYNFPKISSKMNIFNDKRFDINCINEKIMGKSLGLLFQQISKYGLFLQEN